MGETDGVEIDSVGGIPDSGVGMAIGYAAGSKVPYQRGISKYTPTWPRSFMPANQEMRNLVAKMKLIPNKDVLNGKRCLFCDDSIVRGTQLRDSSKALKKLGAKEVHMRIACPPLIYACPFINFSASKNELELITRRVIQDFETGNTKATLLKDAHSTENVKISDRESRHTPLPILLSTRQWLQRLPSVSDLTASSSLNLRPSSRLSVFQRTRYVLTASTAARSIPATAAVAESKG